MSKLDDGSLLYYFLNFFLWLKFSIIKCKKETLPLRDQIKDYLLHFTSPNALSELICPFWGAFCTFSWCYNHFIGMFISSVRL